MTLLISLLVGFVLGRLFARVNVPRIEIGSFEVAAAIVGSAAGFAIGRI